MTKASLLVVDDDELVRMSLELEASDAGFHVASAGSGPEALELAGRNHFDVVVCDIRMPGMDGLEVIERLKSLQPYAGTIVITAYASPDTPVRALKLRVDDYLLKPFDGPTFLASVRQVLGRNRQQRSQESVAHADALLGILHSTVETHRLELAEFAASRAAAGGLTARAVRLVYLCALLYDTDLSNLAPFSGLRKVARLLREARAVTAEALPEAVVLAQAVCDFEEGRRADSFSLPEASWVGVDNLLRLADKHRAMERWDLAETFYTRVLEQGELDEETAGEVRLQQFLLSIQRGKPNVSLGQDIVQFASDSGQSHLEARARLHLSRVSQFEPEELRRAQEVFQASGDSVEAAACVLLLDRAGESATLEETSIEEQALRMLPELSTDETAACQVKLFGPFRVISQGQTMPDSEWVSRKDRLLFAYLCAHPGRMVTEECLLELLWKKGGNKARHSLHNSVSQARRILSKFCSQDGKSLIERAGDGYRLGEVVEVDLARFRHSLEKGRKRSLAGEWEEAFVSLNEANKLATGDFLEGDYQEWTFPLRDELSACQIEVLSLLARHSQARGKGGRAHRYWSQVVELDNCNEEAYEALLCRLRKDRARNRGFQALSSRRNEL